MRPASVFRGLMLHLILLAFGVGPPAHGAATGDFNADGAVDVVDAVATLRVTVGLDESVPAAVARADVMVSGGLDVQDAVLILRKTVGLQEFLPVDPGRTSEKLVPAAGGGALDLPDGSKLEIPPGALTADTLIRVTVPTTQPSPGGTFRYRLEPDGLQLLTPATLSLTYADPPGGLEPVFTVWNSSSLNPLKPAGDELTRRQYAEIVEQDAAADALKIKVDHFSYWNAFFNVDRYAYLVYDLPAKFLKPADLLVSLTSLNTDGHPDWNPGHVGVYTGCIDDDHPDGAPTIIDSTSADEPTLSGVHSKTLGKFRTGDGHLYMGARRPAGGLTSGERRGILTFLQAQLGKGYSLVGQGNVAENAFSCSGLAEAAYDSVNRGMLDGWEEATASAPLEVYGNTVPVSDVRVNVGEEVKIPMYGVIVHPDSPYFGLTLRGWYGSADLYALEYEFPSDPLSPPGATLTGNPHDGYTFNWTPRPQDACKSYRAMLKLTAHPTASVPGGAFDLGEIEQSHTLNFDVNPLAVKLDYALGNYPAGSVVSLCDIEGWRIGHHAEGCAGDHLHAFGEQGIKISGNGPFIDENPSGCGYGPIVPAGKRSCFE